MGLIFCWHSMVVSVAFVWSLGLLEPHDLPKLTPLMHSWLWNIDHASCIMHHSSPKVLNKHPLNLFLPIANTTLIFPTYKQIRFQVFMHKLPLLGRLRCENDYFSENNFYTASLYIFNDTKTIKGSQCEECMLI